MTTETKIKTWSCDSCVYVQDFNPDSQQHIDIHSVAKNVCPSCGGNMKKETDANRLIKHNTITNAEIESLKDENGNSLTAKAKSDLKAQRDSYLAKTLTIKHVFDELEK